MTPSEASWRRGEETQVEAGKLKDKFPFADFVRAFLELM